MKLKKPAKCRVCDKVIEPGQDCEFVKQKKGPIFYVHTDCVKINKNKGGTKT